MVPSADLVYCMSHVRQRVVLCEEGLVGFVFSFHSELIHAVVASQTGVLLHRTVAAQQLPVSRHWLVMIISANCVGVTPYGLTT